MRYERLKQRIRDLRQLNLASDEQIQELLDYLEQHWFGEQCPWRHASCRVRLFDIPELVRVCLLASTNNATERLFKFLQEAGFHNFVNKLMVTFALALLDRMLPLQAETVCFVVLQR